MAADAKPTVGLRVWLADLTYTQQAVSAETMPQAVAALATYAGTRMNLTHLPRVFKYPEALAAALRDDGPPDVIGFSNYIWNSRLSLAVAARVKARFPNVVTVLGGPHYPLTAVEQERFWRNRFGGAVDFYIDGEGEQAFTDLLLALAAAGSGRLHGTLPGVHSIDPDGRAHLPPPRPRLADLSGIPSPYTAGLLDEFFDGHLVPTVQTNRGCPFTCTFCQEGTGYFTRVARKAAEQVAAELHYIGARMRPLVEEGAARNELLVTDSNFGMFAEDVRTCEVIAECQDAYGWPRVVNVTTGKNQRDRVLDAVSRARGAISLSGAVQSLDPRVLKAVKRANISADKLMEVALAATQQGTGTYSEVILALPGDSKAKHLATLDRLTEAGFDRLNMFQLALLPGSELYAEAARREYGMVTRWRVIPRCFGRYSVLGEELVTAELDEVCVELPDLPYADYVECRLVDLLVGCLYNGGVFGVLVKLLRAYGVRPFRWLELARQLPHGPALAAVLAAYLADTDRQLWADPDALLAYATRNVDRYLAGDLGSNLLYTHRTRALTEALADLADLARRACLAALAEVGVAGNLVRGFVAEAADYHRLRLAGLFVARPPQALKQTARFDMNAFLSADSATIATRSLDAFMLPSPAVRHFVLTDRQCDLLATYLAEFGATPSGIGRLLTKVRLADIVRQVHTTAEAGDAVSLDPPPGAWTYRTP
jgi:radical SAM superfamily enzyme YgiQ (UPF0313 family)